MIFQGSFARRALHKAQNRECRRLVLRTFQHHRSLLNRRVHLRGNLPKRSEEHTSELQSRFDIVCRLPLEKKKESSRNLASFAMITSTRSGEVFLRRPRPSSVRAPSGSETSFLSSAEL